MRMLKLRRVLVLALTMSIILPVMSLSAANLGQTSKKFDALTSSKSGGMTISPTAVGGPTTKVSAKTTTKMPACKVGDRGPGGGIVFYVSAIKINVQPGISLGGHCLEAAPRTWKGTTGNQVIPWQCWAPTAVVTGVGIGKGAVNTRKIMAGCDTLSIVIRRVANLIFGGKSDWFVPSRNELNLMYTNLYSPGVGGFAAGFYWGSSEKGGDWLWLQPFNIELVDYEDPNIYYVWPVRAYG